MAAMKLPPTILIPIEGNLRLRNYEPEDADSFFSLISSSRDFLGKFNHAESSLDEVQQMVARARQRHHKDGFGFSAGLWNGNSLIGSFSANRIRWNSKRADIGFWIGKPHCEQGYASKGLRALVQYCFQDLGLNRIEATTVAENEPSIRLLKRHGFTNEGRLRQTVLINGRFYDELAFGLLKNEWDQRYGEIQKRTTTTYSQFTLKGNNLVLRDFREKDLPTYAKWLEPGHEWQNFDGPYYRQTLPAINPRLEKRKLMIESNSFPEPRMQVVIADINTDTLIGEANCYWNSAEIFWMSMGIDIFNSSLWGKGYGREALTLWIQYLFDAHPKLARLGLETWSGNHGMIKLALRLGFKEEARIRKARIVNGERYDALTFGLLREEWK